MCPEGSIANVADAYCYHQRAARSSAIGWGGGGALCNFFLLDPHADAAPFRMIFRIQVKGPPASIDPIFSPFSFFLYSGARQFELVMHL